MSLIAAVSLAVPIPLYCRLETRFLTLHNGVDHLDARHHGHARRHGFPDAPDQRAARAAAPIAVGDAAHLHRVVVGRRARRPGPVERRRQGPRAADAGGGGGGRRGWLPASFVRFLWFCVALSVGLLAYVIGEAYAEIYLRTLPHNSLETVVYVYGWVATVHLLDALTGWMLGIREGERVGSYPLSWVFKLCVRGPPPPPPEKPPFPLSFPPPFSPLPGRHRGRRVLTRAPRYFMLTYQMYVRALYARLRSPSQFVILQVLSSTGLVVMTPLAMTRGCHRALTLAGLNGQSYAAYQKTQARNVLIRFLAENASMAAFLGSITVLHFGANKDVYPYFAFDDDGEPYDFRLTFRASSVTWACELAAGVAVRWLLRLCFGVDVDLEGKLDLAV